MAEHAWTLAWNEKDAQFIARFRRFPPPPFASDDSAWGTKRVPKRIRRHQQLDAERFMISWYASHMSTGGLNTPTSDVVPALKTLRLLGPRWLAYRYEDRGTKINTYNGLKQSLHNWILDNDRFDHASLERLDMQRDFTADVCLAWISSLRGEDSSVLTRVLAASTLFNDCIALGWIDADLPNPFERPAIKKVIGNLIQSRREDQIVTFLSVDQVAALLTAPTRKVTDFRRVRYLLTLATGLRDHEVQGLIWLDVHLDDSIPYLYVERQLDKIGCKPFLSADDLARAGKSKDEVMATPNALVSPPKRNSRRAIPLLPLAVEVLRWWRSAGWKVYVGVGPRKDDPIFPSGKANRHNPPGQFVFVESPELLRKDLERVGEETTFKGIALDFHALRKTFATLLNMNGVSEAEVGDLLGHGARSVARGHYISPELLGRRLELLRRLPLPERVQVQAAVIAVPAAQRVADVIRLPVDRLRR